MLWNVPPDVLPGSATVPYVLDRLLNGWNYIIIIILCTSHMATLQRHGYILTSSMVEAPGGS